MSESSAPPPLPSFSATSGSLPPPPSLPKPTPVEEVEEVSDAIILPDDPGPVAVPDLVPEDALDAQIGDLEAWAVAIVRRARVDAARFWTLRGLAFCAAATAVVLAVEGYERLPVALMALCALAAAIELSWPGTSLHHARRRAVYELRELQSTVKLRWQKVRLSHPDTNSRKRTAYAVELLETIHHRQKEIASLLGTAEPNLGINRPG